MTSVANSRGSFAFRVCVFFPDEPHRTRCSWPCWKNSVFPRSPDQGFPPSNDVTRSQSYQPPPCRVTRRLHHVRRDGRSLERAFLFFFPQHQSRTIIAQSDPKFHHSLERLEQEKIQVFARQKPVRHTKVLSSNKKLEVSIPLVNSTESDRHRSRYVFF